MIPSQWRIKRIAFSWKRFIKTDNRKKGSASSLLSSSSSSFKYIGYTIIYVVFIRVGIKGLLAYPFCFYYLFGSICMLYIFLLARIVMKKKVGAVNYACILIQFFMLPHKFMYEENWKIIIIKTQWKQQ